MESVFRKLPSVNEVLALGQIQDLYAAHGHALVVDAIRQELDELRSRLRSQLQQGDEAKGDCDVQGLAERVRHRLHLETQPNLRRVINATGIVLHTNLGRAPMAEEAAQAAYEASRRYLNLELDLETGKRSSRQIPVREWICQVTGAESATVVNNNAAATVITLRALCGGKEVILSRGQLIEIGGSFRIPDIMRVSGATLREVGTTNITKLSDYESAITPETAALMQIHTSNYRIAGFTRSVPIADLVALGNKHDITVIDDIGSGAMLDFGRFGFSDEPTARDSIAAGADLVLCSGDKLLGGPQAGIILGRKEWIQKIEKDPLMRAFRLDKMTLAALEASFRLYLNQERALKEIPVLRMLGTPLDELKTRAETLAALLKPCADRLHIATMEDKAFVGGGSLPDQSLPTWVVSLEPRTDQPHLLSDDDLAQRLRTGTPAVMGRLQAGKLLLDVRTIFPDQLQELVTAVRHVLN